MTVVNKDYENFRACAHNAPEGPAPSGAHVRDQRIKVGGSSFHYYTGEWMHLFGPGPQETRCRIVIDMINGELCQAQVWNGFRFEAMSKEMRDDLEESVIRVNEAHKEPESFDLTPGLPTWSRESK